MRHFRHVARAYGSWRTTNERFCGYQKAVRLLATASVTVLLTQQYLRPDVVHALKLRKVRTQLPEKAHVSTGRERGAE